MADTFGWRVTFALVSVLTAVLMASMAVSLPRNSHPAKIGFLRQFRLFFDRRIQLGVADVVFGAAASYVFYTYLSPIMRDEIGVPERYISIGLVIYGCACLAGAAAVWWLAGARACGATCTAASWPTKVMAWNH